MSQKIIVLSSDEEGESASQKDNSANSCKLPAEVWLNEPATEFCPQIIGVSTLAFGNPFAIPTPEVHSPQNSKAKSPPAESCPDVFDLDLSPTPRCVSEISEVQKTPLSKHNPTNSLVQIKDTGPDVITASSASVGKLTSLANVSPQRQVEDEFQADSCTNDNDVLFEKFRKLCLDLETVPADKAKLKDKMGRAFERADSSYKKSAAFTLLLTSQLSILESNNKRLYFCVKEILDQLKGNKARRIAPTVVTSNRQKHDNIARADDNMDVQFEDESEGLAEVSTIQNRDIAKLSRTLEKLSRKIKKLGEAEVDLDDDYDSNYLRMRRYEERFAKVNKKLRELTGEPMHLGFFTKKKIKFNGTSNKEVNALMEQWLNKRRVFPDFPDVHKLLKENAGTLCLNLTPERLRDMASEAFRAVGKQLQKRRKLDAWDTLQAYAEAFDDPTAKDPQLEVVLRQNKQEFLRQTDELCNKFCQRQFDEHLEPVEVPDNAPSSEGEGEDEEVNDEIESGAEELPSAIAGSANSVRKETKNGYKNCKSKWLRDQNKGVCLDLNRLQPSISLDKLHETATQLAAPVVSLEEEEVVIAGVSEPSQVVLEKTVPKQKASEISVNSAVRVSPFNAKKQNSVSDEPPVLILEGDDPPHPEVFRPSNVNLRDLHEQENVRHSISSENSKVVLEESSQEEVSVTGPSFPDISTKIVLSAKTKTGRSVSSDGLEIILDKACQRQIVEKTAMVRAPTTHSKNAHSAGLTNNARAAANRNKRKNGVMLPEKLLSKSNKTSNNSDGDLVVIDDMENNSIFSKKTKKVGERSNGSANYKNLRRKENKRRQKFDLGAPKRREDIRINPYQGKSAREEKNIKRSLEPDCTRKSPDISCAIIKPRAPSPICTVAENMSLSPVCIITQPRSLRRPSSGIEDDSAAISPKRRKILFGNENTRPRQDENECVLLDEKPAVIYINSVTVYHSSRSKSVFQDLKNIGCSFSKRMAKKHWQTELVSETMDKGKHLPLDYVEKKLRPKGNLQLEKRLIVRKRTVPVKSHGTGVSGGETAENQPDHRQGGEKEKENCPDKGKETAGCSGSSSGDKDPNDRENGDKDRQSDDGDDDSEGDYAEATEDEDDFMENTQANSAPASTVEDLMEAIAGGSNMEFAYGEAIDQETFDKEILNHVAAEESGSAVDERDNEEAEDGSSDGQEHESFSEPLDSNEEMVEEGLSDKGTPKASSGQMAEEFRSAEGERNNEKAENGLSDGQQKESLSARLDSSAEMVEDEYQETSEGLDDKRRPKSIPEHTADKWGSTEKERNLETAEKGLSNGQRSNAGSEHLESTEMDLDHEASEGLNGESSPKASSELIDTTEAEKVTDVSGGDSSDGQAETMQEHNGSIQIEGNKKGTAKGLNEQQASEREIPELISKRMDCDEAEASCYRSQMPSEFQNGDQIAERTNNKLSVPNEAVTESEKSEEVAPETANDEIPESSDTLVNSADVPKESESSRESLQALSEGNSLDEDKGPKVSLTEESVAEIMAEEGGKNATTSTEKVSEQQITLQDADLSPNNGNDDRQTNHDLSFQENDKKKDESIEERDIDKGSLSKTIKGCESSQLSETNDSDVLQDFSGESIIIKDVREVEKREFEESTCAESVISVDCRPTSTDLSFGDVTDSNDKDYTNDAEANKNLCLEENTHSSNKNSSNNIEDDIEIISESLTPRSATQPLSSQDLTPDERVKRFLQNVPVSIEITRKRKRVVSDEAKQALERLKRLKGVSATRVQPVEPDIMVLPSPPTTRNLSRQNRVNAQSQQPRSNILSRQPRPTTPVRQLLRPNTALGQRRPSAQSGQPRPVVPSGRPRPNGAPVSLRGSPRPLHRVNGIFGLRPRGNSLPFQSPRLRGNMFPSLPMPNGFPRTSNVRNFRSPMILSVRGNLQGRGRGGRGVANPRGGGSSARGRSRPGSVQCVVLD